MSPPFLSLSSSTFLNANKNGVATKLLFHAINFNPVPALILDRVTCDCDPPLAYAQRHTILLSLSLGVKKWGLRGKKHPSSPYLSRARNTDLHRELIRSRRDKNKTAKERRGRTVEEGVWRGGDISIFQSWPVSATKTDQSSFVETAFRLRICV